MPSAEHYVMEVRSWSVSKKIKTVPHFLVHVLLKPPFSIQLACPAQTAVASIVPTRNSISPYGTFIQKLGNKLSC